MWLSNTRKRNDMKRWIVTQSLIVAGSGAGFATSCLASSLESDDRDVKDWQRPIGWTLQRVVVVHRHGDRTPIHADLGRALRATDEENAFWRSTLPPSNVVSRMYDAFGFVDANRLVDENNGSVRGKLTNAGVRELLDVGKGFRRRYVDDLQFLSGKPDTDVHELRLRCTPMSRTIRSALSILTGMYPTCSLRGTDAIRLGVELGDPTPKRPFDRATMWPFNRMCALQSRLRKEYSNIDASVELRTRYDDLVEYYRPRIGFEPDAHVSLGGIMEVLVCREAHGYPVPTSLDNLSRRVTELKRFAFDARHERFCQHGDLLKLYVGRLLGEIVDAMDTGSHKWTQFSGHDSTLIPLISVLNLPSARWPDYAANVVLEVWRRDESDERIVQVFFNGEFQYRKSWSSFMHDTARYTLSSPDEYDEICDGKRNIFA